MKIALCTVSFRHHLIAFADLCAWARANDFDGIEIWGAHARNLGREAGDRHRLAVHGLFVPMISDYLPLGQPTLSEATATLAAIAERWGAQKIRTFAGRGGSGATPAGARRRIAAGLRAACDMLGGRGLSLLVETHPDTLADTLASTSDLIAEVDHPALGINFDAIHVWEGGDDPVAARATLAPKIRHYHLKNVSRRALLPVFANVHDAAGSREGIVPLLDGALDYRPLLAALAADPGCEASLEWFGPDPCATLRRDRQLLRQLIDDLRHRELVPAGK